MKKGKKGRIFARSEGFRSAAAREGAPAGRGPSSSEKEPKLAKRSMNRKSTIMSGRTIGEKRERLETRNERAAARKKDKKKAARRVFLTIAGFLVLIGALGFLGWNFLKKEEPNPIPELTEPTADDYQPTIQIIDEDASAAEGKITSRMEAYIGKLEHDFKDLGYTATKAVIPTGSIREVDFYLQDHPGFIKTTIDRDSAVTAEDADRLIRYLAGQGITDYQYLDVRLPGRAYWK